MMRSVAVAVIAFGLFSPPALGGSGDPPLPKPDPDGHWRVITQDDATTTSRCIGSTTTPLCTMETFMASRVRWGSKAGVDYYNISILILPGEQEKYVERSAEFNKTPYTRFNHYWLKYRILSSDILTKQEIPPTIHWCHKRHPTKCLDLPSAWQPGDVRIKVESIMCHDSKCRDREVGYDDGSVLRRVRGEWKAVMMRQDVNRIDDINGNLAPHK